MRAQIADAGVDFSMKERKERKTDLRLQFKNSVEQMKLKGKKKAESGEERNKAETRFLVPFKKALSV